MITLGDKLEGLILIGDRRVAYQIYQELQLNVGKSSLLNILAFEQDLIIFSVILNQEMN